MAQSLFHLSSSNVSDTFHKLVQTEGGRIADGSGSAITFMHVTASHAVSASHEITLEISSSYAESSSHAATAKDADKVWIEGLPADNSEARIIFADSSGDTYQPLYRHVDAQPVTYNTSTGQISVPSINSVGSVEGKQFIVNAAMDGAAGEPENVNTKFISSDLQYGFNIGSVASNPNGGFELYAAGAKSFIVDAKGNVSASGDFTGSTLYANGIHNADSYHIADKELISRHIIRRAEYGGLEIGNSALANSIVLTGEVTASHISASGNMTADHFYLKNAGNSAVATNNDGILYFGNSGTWTNLQYGRLNTVTHSFQGGIRTQGTIEAYAGNISASGNIYASELYIDSKGVFSATGGSLDALHLAEGGAWSSYHYGRASQYKPHSFYGNITSSRNIAAAGNISASGNIYASDYWIEGKTAIDYVPASSKIVYGQNNQTARIRGKSIELGADTTQHVTASGNISSSGDIDANVFRADGHRAIIHGSDTGITLGIGGSDARPITIFGTAITASGNISSSGNISATGFISASGNLGAGGNLYASQSLVFSANDATIYGAEEIKFRGGPTGQQDFVRIKSDVITLNIDGTPVVNVDNDSVNFNAANQDIDFKVSYDNGDNAINADGATNRLKLRNHVSIGNNSAPNADSYGVTLLVSGSQHILSGHLSASGDISGSTQGNIYGFNTGSFGALHATGDISASGIISAQYVELQPGGAIRPSANANTITFRAHDHGSGDWMELGSDLFEVNIDARQIFGIEKSGTQTGDITFNGLNDNWDVSIKSDDSSTLFMTDASANATKIRGALNIGNTTVPSAAGGMNQTTNQLYVTGSSEFRGNISGSQYHNITGFKSGSFIDLYAENNAVVDKTIYAASASIAGPIRGKQLQMITANWKDNAGTTEHFIPLVGPPDEQTSGVKEQNAMIMPCNGTIKRIIMRCHFTDGPSVDEDQVTWRIYNRPGNKKMNGTTLLATYTMQNPTQDATGDQNTQSIAISTKYDAFDAIMISAQWGDEGPNNSADRVYVTVVVEHDYDTLTY